MGAKILCTFWFDPETKEAQFQGNVDMMTAAQLLQGIAVTSAVKKARKEGESSKAEKPSKPEKKKSRGKTAEGA